MSEPIAEPEGLTVHVHFTGGEDLPILFASNIFVRSEQVNFLVSFAQAHGPYEVNPELQRLADEGIAAKIIGRYSIPADRWKAMLDVAVSNYTVWAQAHQAPHLELVQTMLDQAKEPPSDSPSGEQATSEGTPE